MSAGSTLRVLHLVKTSDWALWALRQMEQLLAASMDTRISSTTGGSREQAASTSTAIPVSHTPCFIAPDTSAGLQSISSSCMRLRARCAPSSEAGMVSTTPR